MADETRRFNVTFSGDCPACSMRTTVTGVVALVPAMGLGDPHDLTVPCMIDGTPTPMRLVGMALTPFVATDPTADDDDEEPQDEFEVGDAERPIDG